jgi:hypothetical protein
MTTFRRGKTETVNIALPDTMLHSKTPEALQASTLNDAEQYHHDRDDQENVNESAHGVRRNQAQQPEDNQDNRNSFEHFFLLLGKH